PINSGRMATS
ncbi:putative secretion and cellular translocation protein Q, partial [Chlamydia psittaci 84-8471/1]